MTISSPIRIILLAAVALALGAGAFVLLSANHSHPATTEKVTGATQSHASARVVHHTVHTHRQSHAAATLSNPDMLPATLTQALRYHSIVVAVLYAPGVTGETGAVALARQGARSVHAGFVPLNVRSERIAESVALRFPTSFDPAVLIIDHDGRVVTELDGVQQSTTVAQAVLDARR